MIKVNGLFVYIYIFCPTAFFARSCESEEANGAPGTAGNACMLIGNDYIASRIIESFLL